MKKSFIILLSILLFICFCFIFPNNLSYLYSPKILEEFPLEKKWVSILPNEIKYVLYVPDMDKLFVRTSKSIYSINPISGKSIWNFDINSNVEDSSIQYMDGRLYASNNSGLWALDAASGHQIWNKKVDCGMTYYIAAVSNNTIISNCVSSKIVAYEIDKGIKKWEKNMRIGENDVFIENQKIYITSFGLKVYDEETGKLLLGDFPEIISGFGHSNGILFDWRDGNSKFDKVIRAYDINNRKLLWETKAKGNRLLQMAIYQDSIIVSTGSNIYKITQLDGKIEWEAKLSDAINISILNNELYVWKVFSNDIYALSIETGEQLGQLNVAPYKLLATDERKMTTTKNLLVFGYKKNIYAYGNP